MDPVLVDKLIDYYIDNQPVDYVANIFKEHTRVVLISSIQL